MKKILLVSLLVLGVGDIWSGVIDTSETSIERDDISIRLNQIPKYKTILFGAPYRIQITNKSQHPIQVAPSIISSPLAPYQDVAKVVRAEQKFFGGVFTIGAALLGSMSWHLSRNMGEYKITVLPKGGQRWKTGNSPFLVKAGFVTSGLAGMLGAHLLYKLATEKQQDLEAVLEKESFYAPITIQPGQTIEKLFWLKKPNNPVIINFNTIKMLQ